ncbi:hypothetical protein ACVIIY_007992 [Bradyrhizobium sp. USDA 4515]
MQNTFRWDDCFSTRAQTRGKMLAHQQTFIVSNADCVAFR